MKLSTGLVYIFIQDGNPLFGEGGMTAELRAVEHSQSRDRVRNGTTGTFGELKVGGEALSLRFFSPSRVFRGFYFLTCVMLYTH
jgi:hypothetical protein